MSVVNALSEWLEVWVKRDGKLYHQIYERGTPIIPVEEIGVSEASGTIISFKPDYEIFEELEITAEIIILRLRELAFLNGGLTISLKDERTDEEHIFHNEGGIIDFVRYLNKNKDTIHSNTIYFKCEKEQVILEVALQYNNSYSENIYSFANNIRTQEGGTHEIGFRTDANPDYE